MSADYFDLKTFESLPLNDAYAVIGNPIGHSMSPPLHAALVKGINYIAVLVDGRNGLKKFCSLAKSRLKGFNVTIPYKKEILKYLDELDPAARKTQSVNTVLNFNGKLKGFNTDIYGIAGALKYNNINCQGKRALVLGGGGAAAAAVEALESMGAEVTVAVRNVAKAKKTFIKDNIIDLRKIDGFYDILINCTPCGMKGQEDTSAIEITQKNYGFVYDTVYNPLTTKLLKQAQSLGIKTDCGAGMLVFQAIEAQRIWGNVQNVPPQKAEELINLVKAQVFAQRQGGKCVALCGFMGSGKSTVAKCLQNKYKIKYIDTDSLITSQTGMAISEIFNKYGEEYFRRIESEIICNIDFGAFKVISLGGGAVTVRKNVDCLKENCKIIYISVALDTVLKRAKDNTRPLLSQNGKKTAELYQKRKKIYQEVCDYTVDGEKDLQEVCEDIISL